MAKKVLIVATVLKKHIMQFHIPTIKMLKEMGYEVDVAARNDYEDMREINIPYADNYYDIPISRNPFATDNIAAYKALKHLIDNGYYDIIHCHTPMGGFLARICAKESQRKGTKIIYTAHGFHFFKGAPAINWMLYYPMEYICSKYTDVLITVNIEDYELAIRRLKAKKIELIPGIGVDVRKFHNTPRDGHNGKVLLSVGELIYRKNHISVSKAIKGMEGIEFVIAGDGKLYGKMQSNATLLGYREDIKNVYAMADLYIQSSFQEGMPVAVMEAMASGIPVIASDVRGNRDLIPKEMLFDPRDIKSIKDKINEYLYRDNTDVINHNYEKVKEHDVNKVLTELRRIYEEL